MASRFGGAIINADSLAFYRGFDVGSAKPTGAERAVAPHYLFDVVGPMEPFTAQDFIDMARPLIYELSGRGVLPLVVGGTGLYLRSLIQGLFPGVGRDESFRAELRERERAGEDLYDALLAADPLAASKLHRRDRARIARALEVKRLTGESLVKFQEEHGLAESAFEALFLVLDWETEELDRRLKLRVARMLEEGLIEETQALLRAGVPRDAKPMLAIGYKETAAYLADEKTLPALQEEIYLRTRQLAKRQRTWFRGQAPEAVWIKPESALAARLIASFLKK
jgi:tRNA dimethylallyltransferase